MYLYYSTADTGAGLSVLESIHIPPHGTGVRFKTADGYTFTLPCESEEEAAALLQDCVQPLDGQYKTLDKYKVKRRGGVCRAPILDISDCELDVGPEPGVS